VNGGKGAAVYSSYCHRGMAVLASLEVVNLGAHTRGSVVPPWDVMSAS
jgi:hypothetical protein